MWCCCSSRYNARQCTHHTIIQTNYIRRNKEEIDLMIEKHHQKISFVIVLFLTTTLIASFALTPYSGFASTENNRDEQQSEE
jgi:hypothetical protein